MRATGAVPFFYDRLPGGRPADPDLAKDSVRYHDLPITPLFPFGHALIAIEMDIAAAVFQIEDRHSAKHSRAGITSHSP